MNMVLISELLLLSFVRNMESNRSPLALAWEIDKRAWHRVLFERAWPPRPVLIGRLGKEIFSQGRDMSTQQRYFLTNMNSEVTRAI